MKAFTFIIAILFVTSSYAESPTEMFSTADNITDVSKITWITTDDIQSACNKQRIKHGGKAYPYKVDACSAWTSSIFGNKCEIITRKKTNMHIIGHEMRHCFQGGFHK